MRKLKAAKKSNIKLIGAHSNVVTATVTAQPTNRQPYTGWSGRFHKHSNRIVAVFIKRDHRAIPFSAAHGTCSA